MTSGLMSHGWRSAGNPLAWYRDRFECAACGARIAIVSDGSTGRSRWAGEGGSPVADCPGRAAARRP